MTTPEEPRLHGAFAEQLRALQASDATEAELAWVGTRLLALQQQYTRDLDTAGFGDAGREAFTDAYCADAPHDPERRSQATVLWHTSVLPENVLGGVIPAPPRDPIVETIRHARHTAVAYSAAREEYAGAWIDEDIPTPCAPSTTPTTTPSSPEATQSTTPPSTSRCTFPCREPAS
ncbi:phosphotransferase [Yinghuangia aomiensis]